MKAVWIALALLTSAVPCFAQDDPVVDPGSVAKPVATDQQLLHKYVWSTRGLEGAIGATMASGLDQWKRSPPHG